MASEVKLIGGSALLMKLKSLSMIPTLQDAAKIGNTAVAGVKSNFEGGNPLKWAPLAQSTKKTKGSSRILVDKGHMKNSVFWRYTDKGVTLISRDRKAAWHQFGTRPYEIDPRIGPKMSGKRHVLTFLDGRGKRVFTGHVNHPGLKPRPWMVLRDEVIKKITGIVAEILGKKVA